MSVLKTDYVDDVINEELAADRKFGEVQNEDGTKKIQISVLLILQTKSAESSKQADIYVEYV